jgi:hypothetical protein
LVAHRSIEKDKPRFSLFLKRTTHSAWLVKKLPIFRKKARGSVGEIYLFSAASTLTEGRPLTSLSHCVSTATPAFALHKFGILTFLKNNIRFRPGFARNCRLFLSSIPARNRAHPPLLGNAERFHQPNPRTSGNSCAAMPALARDRWLSQVVKPLVSPPITEPASAEIADT